MALGELTKVYCKADCEFCQNEERVCQLNEIELSQTEPESPILHCNQYVRVVFPSMARRNHETDIRRAMGERLGNTSK